MIPMAVPNLSGHDEYIAKVAELIRTASAEEG